MAMSTWLYARKIVSMLIKTIAKKLIYGSSAAYYKMLEGKQVYTIHGCYGSKHEHFDTGFRKRYTEMNVKCSTVNWI